MVRLKGINLEQFVEAVTRFQFLMVRLKEAIMQRIIQSLEWFQFLMVRLKACCSSRCFSCTRISIPYGAIKRRAERQRAKHHAISIPYGAIKRCAGGAGAGEQCDISIPYGAIKSRSQKRYNFLVILFQFLMVRLKDNSRTTPIQQATRFQFLMVRLKAICMRTADNKILKFQFLMVRLKEVGRYNVSYTLVLFQFLMVRLKASGRWLKMVRQNIISIPYGAIKSRKGIQRSTCTCIHFNSLWCD